jgi:hypothetical protein
MKKRIHLIVLLSCIIIGIFSVQSINADSKVETYNYPRSVPKSTDYQLQANNKEVVVYSTSAGPFAAFSCEGQIKIDIKMPKAFKNVTISPAKLGIIPEIKGDQISFNIPGPNLLAVMVDGMPVLYVYANPFATNVPDAANPKVKYFKAGQVYEVGELRLLSNETLYIEGGAVVRGNIFANSAENVRITGYGVLDGSYYSLQERHRTILLEACKNSIIEDIIIIEPTSWMIVLGVCEHIIVRHIKELGFVLTSDGVDVVGSSHIRVENCFLRNCDDCIAIKSFDMRRYDKSITMDWSKDMDDVEVNGCILWSYGGQVFEFGHELTTEFIKNIRFIDCDAVVHNYGGVFGIHNSDRVTISDVLFENIRVEHYFNLLIDFKIMKSRAFKDEQRGQVRNVTFRNIDVKVNQYNLGVSVSHIGGYDAKHMIQNVVFDNFVLDGVKVVNADQLDLYIKQASKITFK